MNVKVCVLKEPQSNETGKLVIKIQCDKYDGISTSCYSRFISLGGKTVKVQRAGSGAWSCEFKSEFSPIFDLKTWCYVYQWQNSDFMH